MVTTELIREIIDSRIGRIRQLSGDLSAGSPAADRIQVRTLQLLVNWSHDLGQTGATNKRRRDGRHINCSPAAASAAPATESHIGPASISVIKYARLNILFASLFTCCN